MPVPSPFSTHWDPMHTRPRNFSFSPESANYNASWQQSSTRSPMGYPSSREGTWAGRVIAYMDPPRIARAISCDSSQALRLHAYITDGVSLLYTKQRYWYFTD